METIKLNESDIQRIVKRIIKEEISKPSEKEFKQALKDIHVLIPSLSHQRIHDEGLVHNSETMIRLNREVLEKVKEGDDEVLDKLWEIAGTLIMKNAINTITFYTKRIIKESILDNWFKKNTLKTLINRSAYSYNMHDVIIKKGDDIIIWLKPFPKSSYSEEDQQYVLNIENETLSVYGRGLNNEPDSVYSLSEKDYNNIYKKIYHLL